MKIGIDIGGTHTDGALVDGETILRTCKLPTTDPLEKGVAQVLAALAPPEPVEAVYVGTTHATNAILEAKNLCHIGLIRIAGHRPQLPPCYSWPAPLREAVLAGHETISGGFECDGRPITPFSIDEARAAIDRLLAAGAQSIAIVGTFSPISAEQEEAVASLLPPLSRSHSLSHSLGGVGFLERENATILNCALKRVIAEGFAELHNVVDAPLMMTQNNGTIITLQEALERPILTLSAGPTNSFVGGARLASLREAIIVDIGGTSTDVGVVLNGFARRCINQSQIGGVALNFPMPDVLSIAIGGGSHVTPAGVGPESCARRLKDEARAFGGPTLTLTDVALSLGHLSLPDALPVAVPDAQKIVADVMERIDHLVQRAEAGRSDLPVVVVGGGASLLPEDLPERFLVPQHAGAANAIGATLAEVSGTVDTVVSLEKDRDATLAGLHKKAIERAISAGANPSTVRIATREIVPYHYVPGAMARVVVSASSSALQRLRPSTSMSKRSSTLPTA